MKKGMIVSIISMLSVVALVFGTLYVVNNAEKTRTIDTLNSTISEKENRITALNTDIVNKETEIIELNTDIANKKIENAELNTVIANKETEIAELNTDITYKTGQIEMLKENASKMEEEISELKESDANKTEQIETLNTEVEKLNSEIETALSELAESEKKIITLQKDVQEAAVKISELNTTILEKDEIIKNLKNQLAMESTTSIPTVKQYTGATPVPIFPLERPTATPLPELEFSYQNYVTATNIGVSFDAPTGWEIDFGADYYKLTNPDLSMDYQAFILLEKENCGRSYSISALTRMLKSKLDSIGNGISNFSPSNTAERTFMGTTGIYANYTGMDDNGAEIAGRIIAACVDNAVYYLHVSYPRTYRDNYVQNVYDRIRHTIQVQ